VCYPACPINVILLNILCTFMHCCSAGTYLTVCTYVRTYSVHVCVPSFQQSVIYELWASLPLAVRVPSANDSPSGGCPKDKVLSELKVKNGRGKLVKLTGESNVRSNGPPGLYAHRVHFGGVYAQKHVGTIVFYAFLRFMCTPVRTVCTFMCTHVRTVCTYVHTV